MNLDTMLRTSASKLIALGLWVCALVLVAFVAAGLLEIAAGLFELLRHVGSGSSKRAVAKALEGLELMFLAPTPLLVLLSLRPYLNSVIQRRDDLVARARMVEVKAFMVSLMVAVIATDLIAKTIEGPLCYESTLTRCIAIVVLGGYFVVLEWLAHRDVPHHAG
jgi:hypothetical protein